MNFTAIQIAKLINGKVEGDSTVSVNSLSKIEEGKENSITFLANSKYEHFLYTTNSSIIVVNDDLKVQKKISATLIRVKDPYQTFANLLEIFNKKKNNKFGLSPKSEIHESALIGSNVYVGSNTTLEKDVKIGNGTSISPNCFVGEGVTIGENTIIHPNVTILHDSKIGSNCVIHSGTTIGSDGFGFAPNSENHFHKVPQIGNVVIEDHVEVGSNTSIDRATLGSTIIRKGVKLDNLIQIAHNVEIGSNSVIAAQTGIAGSTKIGKNCMIGGQVGIVGHITIADDVKIAAQSGIGSSILEKGAVVQGSPAIPIGDYKRAFIIFKQLPKVAQKLRQIEKLISKFK